jgi:DNA-binding beta-propeller fold protein YncE
MSPTVLRRALPMIFCIFAGCLVFTEAGTPNLLQPIALWPASTGGLYALDRTEGLFYLPGAGADLYLKNSVKFAAFRASWQTIDMTAVPSGTDDRVYVVLGQETIGMLACYSNRRFERSWIAKTLLTGIASDPAGHRLFLSGGLKNEIYELDTNDPGASPTKLFVGVHDSQILGPLVFDAKGHTLYAGDQRTGTIFSIDVESKSVSKLVQIAGQPNALAFDSSRRALLIADSVGRKVWLVSVDKKNAKAQIFSSSSEFRQPTAIAIDSSGGIWVGDQESKAIFRLSPSGATTSYHLILGAEPGSQP